MKIKLLGLIIFFVTLTSCDENPEAYTPDEKILSLEIENDINNIAFDDEVTISAVIEINVDDTENVQVGFNDDIGQLFYNGIEYSVGDYIEIDTTTDITFTYIPMENPAASNDRNHKVVMIVVDITKVNNDNSLDDNYSADFVSFKIGGN